MNYSRLIILPNADAWVDILKKLGILCGMEAILSFILMIGVMLLYFAPSYIAYTRNHKNGLPIFFVNLIFGFTLIGWLVAFIWAFTDNVAIPVKVINQPEPTTSALPVFKEGAQS